MTLRPTLRTIALTAAALLAAPAMRAAELFPFVLPWDDATPSVTNLSSWLDKPAGKDGFITARDGHLYAGQKRIRIFGVNMAFGGNFPNHADAEQVAARLAKFGINCVRFHDMDTSFAPEGLLEKDKRTFNPESLDRLDYFIAQLRKNGIYSDLNLHDGLEYPGFKRWEGAPNSFKGVDNFFPALIQLQREYARKLLTHINPYTHKAYIDEPAIAFIEINDENSLIKEWNNGTLDAMPDPFAADLKEQWNVWLKKRYNPTSFVETWNKGIDPFGPEKLKPAHDAWSLEQHGDAKGDLSFEPGQGGTGETFHVHIAKPGTESSHIQLGQGGFPLGAKRTYTFTMRAKSDAPRRITVALTQMREPFKVIVSESIELSKEWQDVRIALPIPDAEDKARLTFTNLGAAVGDCWFSNVSLRLGGVVGVKEGEVLGNIPIFRRKDVAGRTFVAQRDWTVFMVDTEVNYWTTMRRFIREDLHAHSHVLGSATGSSPWLAQSKLDVVDAHSYWQQPRFPHRPGDLSDWAVPNVSMAGAPDGGTLAALALRRVAGKPFVVTEYNASAPNTYSSEAFLEVCAMAGLQDWDGIFAFSYCRRTNDWDTQRITNFFDIDQHPTKMATLPAAMALFTRGDIEAPGEPVVADINWGEAVDSVHKNGAGVDGSAYGFTRLDAFRHPIGMRIAGNTKLPVPVAPTPTDAALLRSDNGQLTWDITGHRMLLASPRSAGVVGSVKAGETIELEDVRIIPGATRQNWATINATVIDGLDFLHANRILVTATGAAENSGMKWKDTWKTSVGTEWGTNPSVVEGISAKIGVPYQKGVQAWTLDSRGQRVKEIPVKRVAGKSEIEISSAHQTLWWEIAVP